MSDKSALGERMKTAYENGTVDKNIKNLFYDYHYRDYFLAKMKNNSLVVVFTDYEKSSPFQDEFKNSVDIEDIEKEANSQEYYDYFESRGVKPGMLCSHWRNELKPIFKFLKSDKNYDPQPTVVTLGHGKHFPKGYGMSISNYTFDLKTESLLSKTRK
jgi:hypothetical protein